MKYNAMQCNTMQCNAIQCNAIQCNTMTCISTLLIINAMEYNAMQCIVFQLCLSSMQCIVYPRNAIYLTNDRSQAERISPNWWSATSPTSSIGRVEKSSAANFFGTLLKGPLQCKSPPSRCTLTYNLQVNVQFAPKEKSLICKAHSCKKRKN